MGGRPLLSEAKEERHRPHHKQHTRHHEQDGKGGDGTWNLLAHLSPGEPTHLEQLPHNPDHGHRDADAQAIESHPTVGRPVAPPLLTPLLARVKPPPPGGPRGDKKPPLEGLHPATLAQAFPDLGERLKEEARAVVREEAVGSRHEPNSDLLHGPQLLPTPGPQKALELLLPEGCEHPRPAEENVGVRRGDRRPRCLGTSQSILPGMLRVATGQSPSQPGAGLRSQGGHDRVEV